MLLLSLVFGMCGACSEDQAEKDRVEKIVMTVAAEVVEKSYTPPLANTRVMQEFMQVKEEGADGWQEMELGTIAGFRYVDGTEYRLEVEKTFLTNPPADGSSITYKLSKVLSSEVKNQQIVNVQRFRIGTRDVLVQGKHLAGADKKKIEDEMLAGLPSDPWLVYKLVYTGLEDPQGKLVVYIGNTKKEGTFRLEESKRQYIFEVDGVAKTYLVAEPFTRSSVMRVYAFIELLTGQYKAAYPDLELACTQQVIAATM